MLKPALFALLPLLATFDAPRRSLAFADLAANYAKSHGLAGKAAADVKFADVLDQNYVRVDLGAIRLRFPWADLGDKARAKELQDVAVALTNLELKWCEWAAVEGAPTTALRKDLTELRDALTKAHVQGGGGSAAKSFADVFGLKKETAELAQRVEQKFRAQEVWGFKPASDQATEFICEPSRREFVELACFFGWIDESARPAFWVDNLPTWEELYWVDVQAVPLMYASSKSGDDYTNGRSMNDKEPNGMQQFVSQRGAHALFATLYGSNIDPMVESAVVVDIVVDLCGQNNAYAESSSRGKTTEARSVFIPGAPAKGGGLGRNSADSSWRATQGADHFVKPLRDAQKTAAKDEPASKSKLAAFQISSDDTTKRQSIRAPFLGTPAKDKEAPPKEFLGDYAEFFRAYKACFVHWLRTEGSAKGKKVSETSFASAMQKLGNANPDFEAIVSEVYAMPLSNAGEKPDSLEWRFLAWLAKQR